MTSALSNALRLLPIALVDVAVAAALRPVAAELAVVLAGAGVLLLVAALYQLTAVPRESGPAGSRH